LAELMVGHKNLQLAAIHHSQDWHFDLDQGFEIRRLAVQVLGGMKE
jgi:hypothetical protein